jgi:YVTN family beta-propeller protein
VQTRLVSVALAAIMFVPLFTGSGRAEGPSPYRVTKTVMLGAPDRWDLMAFDHSSKRVFVAHGDRVTVVDGRAGSVVGTIDGIAGGTHGVAIAESGRGYTDDGKEGVAVSFDLTTLKTVNRIKAEDDADDVAFDPTSGHIFVINSDPGHVTVIDPKTDSTIATIDGGGKLEISAAGGNGKLYVSGEAKNEIVRIDTASNTVDAHWPMPDCTSPHGLAVDRKTHRLFSSCANSVMTVVNADSGAVIATLPIGQGTDGAAFDPKRKLIFSSNGRDGTLSIIREQDADHFVSLGSVKTAVTGRTIAIDPESGRIYIAAGDIDPNVPVVPGKRPTLVPGSLKLLFLDPEQ